MAARDYPYFSPAFVALAHRGGFGGSVGPELENTFASFANAVALGFTHLETDVHVSRDGVLVAFHDERLDRVTDAVGVLAELPWRELQRARIGGREPIVTLDDLLDAFPDACFNIDLKADDAVAPLARTIARHGAAHRVCVASFSSQRLRRFRRLAGSLVATAIGPAGVAIGTLMPGVRRFIPRAGEALQLPVREERTGVPLVTGASVAAAHGRGQVVHVWTINDADEMNRLIDLGVDGLISDDLLTLRSVLAARGLWATA